MTEPFDAYSQWLDIPRDRRPPNHYELLGLDILESNAERIELAFQKRYSLVRRYQVGEHGAEAVRVLQDLAKAHDCLSDKEAREQYDDKLQREFPDLIPALELVIEAEFAPEVPVEQRIIWVIMPAEGRRWGPLVKSQIEQAVSQGRIRSDFYLQQDDWLEPRPATEFYRNLPSPPPLTPAPTQQTAPGYNAPQSPAAALAAAQTGTMYGHGAVAKPHPAIRKAPGRQPPWKIIIPCIAIGAAVVILLAVSIAIYSTSGGSEQDDEDLRSTASVNSVKTDDSSLVDNKSSVTPADGTGVGPSSGSSQTPNNVSTGSQQATSGGPTAVAKGNVDPANTSPSGNANSTSTAPQTPRASEENKSSFSNGGSTSDLIAAESKFKVAHRLNFPTNASGVRDLDFSSDGRLLASAGGTKIRVCNTASGNVMWEREASKTYLAAVDFAPDNRRVVVGGGSAAIRVFDAANGAEQFSLQSRASNISDVEFSPDGELLAVSTEGGKKIELWDVGQHKTIWTVSHSDPTRSVAFSPDGKMLTVSLRSGTVGMRNYEVETGKLVSQFGSGGVQNVAYSQDGKTILSTAYRRVTLWESGSYAKIRDLRPQNARGSCVFAALIPAQPVAAIVDGYGEVYLVGIATGAELAKLPGTSQFVAVSQNGKSLANADSKNTVNLWEIADAR